MRKPRKPRRVFLDTSAVIYDRLGHSLMRAAVRNALIDGALEVSPFVRMEYHRGVVLSLIEFYFLLKDSESVGDALIDWAQKVAQERKLKVLLMTVNKWVVAHEAWREREQSLRRLGDLILQIVADFDTAYPLRPRDPLRCQLGRVVLPLQPFTEEALLRFYDEFRAIQAGVPRCALCRFRAARQRALARRGVDLCGEDVRQRFAGLPGFVRQAEQLAEAAGTTEGHPACRWCERLGDSILALHLPEDSVFVTADRAFLAFGQLLGRRVHLLPSLAELKRRQQSQGGAGEPPHAQGGSPES